MNERWETVADLEAARVRLVAALGWERPPAAWGLLSEQLDVLKATVAGGHLSAAAVATAVGAAGPTSGTGSWRLGPAELEAALELLGPAEACTEVPHPNLGALRALAAAGGGVAVFVDGDITGDDGDIAGDDDPAVAALLAEIRRGR